MLEVVLYERREAKFEAFPAENYVDYMTNVMPVPETHRFYLPSRGKVIVCEVKKETGGERDLIWRVEGCDEIPNASQIIVDNRRIDEMLKILSEGDTPRRCGLCSKLLGGYLKFYQ